MENVDWTSEPPFQTPLIGNIPTTRFSFWNIYASLDEYNQIVVCIISFSKAGHCDPKGGGALKGPCCSTTGECGNTTAHCDPAGSVNFGEFWFEFC